MSDSIGAWDGVTVGLDLGDRMCTLCVLDQRGEVSERGSVATTEEAIRRRFSAMERSRVVLEVGTHSAWITNVIKQCKHEVLVANPRKVKLIWGDDTKTDENDAERLARVGRMEPRLLGPIQHRSPTTRRHLVTLRARDALVSTRTKLINAVRGFVKSGGGRLPSSSTDSFHKAVRGALPDELRPAVEPLVDQVESLTQAIRDYDKKIKTILKEHYPEGALLQQVPGVGNLTTLAFLLVIEDPTRFKKANRVASYVGLRPKIDVSCSIDVQRPITKAGDTMLRRLLVGSAHYILARGPDTDLKRWGTAVASRGGKNGKKRAAVAVARKLALLLHRLWLTAEEYEPLRNERVQRERAGLAMANA